jgi:hypothetical protein
MTEILLGTQRRGLEHFTARNAKITKQTATVQIG